MGKKKLQEHVEACGIRSNAFKLRREEKESDPGKVQGPRDSAGTSHHAGNPAWRRDPSPGRMDSLLPFWVDSDLNREAAPASDELEEAAEIL